jgi:hypothetical protein
MCFLPNYLCSFTIFTMYLLMIDKDLYNSVLTNSNKFIVNKL